MRSRAILEVDLSLVKRNCFTLQKMNGSRFFCPMIKADAYGHGAVFIAKALLSAGVQKVGVVDLEEAWNIKEQVPDLDILIFGPVFSKEDLSLALEQNFTLVCSHWQSLKSLARMKKNCQVHLNFDTGFSRLGFTLDSASELAVFFKQTTYISLKGIGTQIVSSEDIGNENSFSFEQIKKILKIHNFFPKTALHVLNTAGLISHALHKKPIGLGARPGLGLYGLKPKIFCQNVSVKQQWNDVSLSLVSCLKSYIVDLRRIPSGRGVSYGSLWRAKQDSYVATVSLGYGDGFLRSLEKERKILFRGRERLIIGTVCMDFIMIDLTEDWKDSSSPGIEIGEEVVIFGRQKESFLCPGKQAENSGTIAYELFSRLGCRVERVYKNIPKLSHV